MSLYLTGKGLAEESSAANRGVAGFVSVTDGRREIRSTHCKGAKMIKTAGVRPEWG
jgi:hypothetical protein